MKRRVSVHIVADVSQFREALSIARYRARICAERAAGRSFVAGLSEQARRELGLDAQSGPEAARRWGVLPGRFIGWKQS